MNSEGIDLSDIPELTKEDFARARPNPFAEKLRKNGYKIVINVTPEDIIEMDKGGINDINGMDMFDLDDDEREAFEIYYESLKKRTIQNEA